MEQGRLRVWCSAKALRNSGSGGRGVGMRARPAIIHAQPACIRIYTCGGDSMHIYTISHKSLRKLVISYYPGMQPSQCNVEQHHLCYLCSDYRASVSALFNTKNMSSACSVDEYSAVLSL